MPRILNSYLRYARGEGGRASPWALLDFLGAAARPLVRVRNAMYDRGLFCSMEPPAPVISVGNLCHGGTNKTPTVEMIARRLMGRGLSVGIVSRGYSGGTKSPLWIGQDPTSSDRAVTGDEPLMLANRLPDAKVVVSRDRYEGVRMLHGLGVDVVVADDAFQHRRMGRDLDIVLVDATCPFGNGKLFPAGILREHEDALRRADIVMLTKADLAPKGAIDGIKSCLSRWVPPEDVFTARVDLDSWLVMERGSIVDFEPEWGKTLPDGRFVAFSAIGNPDSFYRSLVSFGMDVAAKREYRDHHRFSWRDLDDLERLAGQLGATGFICTEKDLQNMPENPHMLLPLYIPRISVAVDDGDGFWRAVTGKLKPSIVIASNGYGEDAIGALLASRMKDRFPSADVSAFALVGGGKAYRDRGIEVFSPPSDMPSGGIVKYSLRALVRDLQHGLRQEIKRQIGVWRQQSGRLRTPICVGDVYLLSHTLWGQGMSPVLVATAKSVQLRGHLGAELGLLRRRARHVWTRDAETANELKRAGVDAEFRGNPIMDLALEDGGDADPWEGVNRPRVMLLPGSRPRAYDDAALILRAASLLARRVGCGFLMVLAPTIDVRMLLSGLPREFRCSASGDIIAGDARVVLYSGPIASAAKGADILIGLGGTANQVSAGLGVPVISILEKGKLAQKKLLQDSEILTPPTPEALSAAAEALLADADRMRRMSEAGERILGGPGAIEAVAEYAGSVLGWDARCRLYEELSCLWGSEEAAYAEETETVAEEEQEWGMSESLRSSVMRSVRIIREGLPRWGSEEPG
ncbi:MAG: tetraacyldisaccharide 4'-kinase [Synergistaceae bacterium]|jgi:tetraacyldisaccharide 4'-kinase|nr:tetraacyldisaccharide 4'-kinase [Synergistaceae bacterium]